MKLQKKISIYFFGISLLVFALNILVSYFVLKNLVLEEVDETLEAEKSNLISRLNKQQSPDSIFFNHSYRLEIYPLNNNIRYSQRLSDTLLYVGEEGEGVPFRQIKSSQIIHGKNYLIVLRRSLIEREDLIAGITFLFGIVFFLVFLSLNLINYFGEKKWWKPFYETLEKLTNYNLTQKEKVKFNNSGIDEFNKLNKSLEELIEKMRGDFNNLKEFSENASHEMQTPLAIIRSKLDVMIQDTSLNENQFNTIRSLYDAVNRLSKLNQSLNFLTKLENQEFTQKEDVNISQLIIRQLDNLKELIESKLLQVHSDIEKDILIQINPFIADALISNLLINAIKHNLENGEIFIELSHEKFTIRNTGKPPTVSTEKLFERFKKGDQTSDSQGLGLAIVKKICELNNLNLKYEFKQNFHIITIGFG